MVQSMFQAKGLCSLRTRQTDTQLLRPAARGCILRACLTSTPPRGGCPAPSAGGLAWHAECTPSALGSHETGRVMSSHPHHDIASASAQREGYVSLAGAGLPALPTAPPPEFGGTGDHWSPELRSSTKATSQLDVRIETRA